MKSQTDDMRESASVLQCSSGHHVVRLGGSLLTLPDLAARLRQFLNSLKTNRILLVPGGGTGAQLIRELHLKQYITGPQAHWDAIAAMSSNARLLQRLMPGFGIARRAPDLHEIWGSGRLAILDATGYLLPLHSSPGDQSATGIKPGDHELTNCVIQQADAPAPLPESWHVTSDSIAMWVARSLRCSDVWLLKSCEGPAETLSFDDLQQLASRELVDAYCPQLWIPELAVRWLNLRGQFIDPPESC